MIALFTTALFSFLLSTLAAAQEKPTVIDKLQAPMAMPEYRIGERWVYQGTNLKTKQMTYKIEQVVESVNGERAVFRVTDLAGKITTMGYLVSAQSNLRPDLISGIFENVHFPLDVGTTWEHDLKRHYVEGDIVQGEYKAKAVAWEEVTVPAGTFQAIRIEHEGMWRRPEKRTSGREKHTIWYSPEAKRNVRAIDIDYDTSNQIYNHSETQLIEYELVKR